LVEILKKEKEDFGELVKKIRKDVDKSGFIAVFEITNGHNGYGNSNLIYKKQQLDYNEHFITKKLKINKKNLYNVVLFVATKQETVEGFCKLFNPKNEKSVLFVNEYDSNLLYNTIKNINEDQTLDAYRKGFFSFLYSSIGKNNFNDIVKYFNKNNFKELERLITEYEEKDGLDKHNNKALESYPGKIGFIRGSLAENYAYEIFDFAFKEKKINDYQMFRRVKSEIMLCKRERNCSLFKEQTKIEIDLIIISKKKSFREVLNYLLEKGFVYNRYN
jgi:hypothetical protein